MKTTILLFFIVAFTSLSSVGQIVGVTDYNLEGAIISSGNTEATIIVNDGNALTFSQGTGSIIGQNGGHGAIMSNGNTITMKVLNTANITFSLCKYSSTGATFSFTDEGDNSLGSVIAESKTTNIDEELVTFSFSGSAQTIKATLNAGGSVYLHQISIENIESLPSLEGKTQVWDFGAEALVGTQYSNMLDAASINAWYPGITGGTAGVNLPETFTSDVLTWIGKPSADRLRTTNTALTRYDNKSNGSYTGYVYANGTVSLVDGIPGNRYFEIELEEDDEVSVVAMANNGPGTLTFAYKEDLALQFDEVTIPVGTATEFNFIANQAGTYIFYDAVDKGSYFRVTRKNADFVSVSGTVDESSATLIPNGYGIVFTNAVTGKSWTEIVESAAYSINLPTGHTYNVSLSDANGYVISGNNTIDVAVATTFDLVIEQIDLYTVSGAITGLGADIDKLSLVYTPDPAQNKVYSPELTIDADASTYSVVLEPNCEYTILAEGVNDYSIGSNSIIITGNETTDISFAVKPVYPITLNVSGLTAPQEAVVQIDFTNLYEDGYSYSFSDLSTISLRDGLYSIIAVGTDEYAVEMALTSNLEVSGSALVKDIVFKEVTNWTFDDKEITGDSYKGLLFTGTGTVSSQMSKGHLMAKNGDVISVPAKVGQKMIVSYYYNADFSIDGGDAITTGSGSTSLIETVEYSYPGVVDGAINITVGSTYGTTYITNIEVLEVVPYTATITVGNDKDYQTINEALAAIKLMSRSDEQRVTIEIDPGNYEEMLVVDVDNVSLTNAAVSPSIALKDAGVNIDDNAVRITSYYGHGYSYFSMSNDQKWHANVLAVNIENGYLSYENKGAGTSNGSYWNATVVVLANGFEANNIIFENSFNQYVSAKEAADIVVEWEVGGKGTRPMDAGNTSVQNKAFVERAAAIAIQGGDKIILNNCRVVGHQDSFYGGKDSRVAVYKGNMMGGTDYIFGGMIAVFYKAELALTTSVDGNDVAYITAPQQTYGRGYLMYECTVTSAKPSVDVANTYRSKPGYFGRPWAPNTSEVVFYNTTIETSNHVGNEGESLIVPLGWNSTLSGESEGMSEYNTMEESGANFSGSRATWATQLPTPYLLDGTEITTFNFTKGADNWDPIAVLIANDPSTAISSVKSSPMVNVYAIESEIVLSNVNEHCVVHVYSTQGILVKTFIARKDSRFSLPNGCWIVNVRSQAGSKSVKVLTL
ncbi:pectinesterase family protein [Carboxylicivirga sp. N1Y90]|uniref:pectinesterase family protein n=1 Tax=Carboxylicivirga fragile TaxID=3417571 RepID=UPI003D334FB4|nr:hypothetical protein [Marinilabiliaceae bacterium N1Y90]